MYMQEMMVCLQFLTLDCQQVVLLFNMILKFLTAQRYFNNQCCYMDFFNQCFKLGDTT